MLTDCHVPVDRLCGPPLPSPPALWTTASGSLTFFPAQFLYPDEGTKLPGVSKPWSNRQPFARAVASVNALNVDPAWNPCPPPCTVSAGRL